MIAHMISCTDFAIQTELFVTQYFILLFIPISFILLYPYFVLLPKVTYFNQLNYSLLLNITVNQSAYNT
jgi:phosphoglycerol transferase MdoB-like AlkP superfamily enzyme